MDRWMRTIKIEYPETLPAILNLSPENFEHEAKYALAVQLYELGKLSSGQAASLAGVPRVVFLLNCRKYGADTVEWDKEEIDAEFSENFNE